MPLAFFRQSLRRTEKSRKYGFDGSVPGSARGAEGEGSDPLPPCPQRHSQLGRTSPPLLRRRTIHSFPISPFQSLFFSLPNSFFLLFQASNLRERFEENRHVVRFPLFTYLPNHRICNIVSIHTSLVIFCTLIVFYLE